MIPIAHFPNNRQNNVLHSLCESGTQIKTRKHARYSHKYFSF